MKIARVSFFCLILALMASSQIVVFAQSGAPEKTVKDFYNWYLKTDSATRVTIERYVTARLYQKVQRMNKTSDGDYYTNTSGDMNFADCENIEVSKISATASKAKFRVVLSGTNDFSSDLIVSLIKFGGKWKIDNITGNDDAPVASKPKSEPTVAADGGSGDGEVTAGTSVGVLNDKATNLVKPVYPAAARAIRASGDVSVQVTIDESGYVISASAVSGNPLLRDAAVSAAQKSTFSPTLVNGKAVKVTGVIIYTFTAD